MQLTKDCGSTSVSMNLDPIIFDSMKCVLLDFMLIKSTPMKVPEEKIYIVHYSAFFASISM